MVNSEKLIDKENELLRYKTEVETRIRAQGLTLLAKPSREPPALPDDVTALDDLQLGRLTNRMVSFEIYASQQLGLAALSRQLAEYNFDLCIFRETSGLTGGPQQRKQAAMGSETVRKARLVLEQRKAMETALSFVYGRFERVSRFLSREQSRRQAAFKER